MSLELELVLDVHEFYLSSIGTRAIGGFVKTFEDLKSCNCIRLLFFIKHSVGDKPSLPRSRLISHRGDSGNQGLPISSAKGARI